MKPIDSWGARQPGDVGFIRRRDPFSLLVSEFLEELHEDYTGSFIPTHSFIIDYGELVIEAALTFNSNSVASIHPDVEYENIDPADIQLWRIQRTQSQIDVALRNFVVKYAGAGYGIADLLGFALEAFARHFGNPKARNPILLSYVCSQGTLLFLREDAGEKWPLRVDLNDCDPLELLNNFVANRT